MVYLTLTLAILSEVVATTALKAADGFTRLVPSAVVVVGYALAFYFLSLTLRSMSIGLAYAIWSGLGIVLISAMGAILYGERVDFAAVVGMALIIAGVFVLNVFSGLSGH